MSETVEIGNHFHKMIHTESIQLHDLFRRKGTVRSPDSFMGGKGKGVFHIKLYGIIPHCRKTFYKCFYRVHRGDFIAGNIQHISPFFHGGRVIDLKKRYRSRIGKDLADCLHPIEKSGIFCCLKENT